MLSSKSTPYRFWLDENKQYLPLRFAHVNSDGRELISLAIEYVDDPAHGWTPCSWEHTARNSNSDTIIETVRSTIKEWSLNQRMPDEEVKVPFIEGLLVQDDRKGGALSLVRADGSLRPVTQQEKDRRASYEELLETDSGMAGLGAGSGILRRWYWWIVGATAFVATMLLIVRRRAIRADLTRTGR